MKNRILSVWDLDVFQLAHKLVLKIYKITNRFPKSELYALASQMRRAASSIPMNLAEGAARGSRAEYKRYVAIARGSVGEVTYQLYLSRDLKYVDNPTFSALHDDFERVGRMLTRLAQSLSAKNK